MMGIHPTPLLMPSVFDGGHPNTDLIQERSWMTPVHTTSAAAVIASPDPPARNFLMLCASTLVQKN